MYISRDLIKNKDREAEIISLTKLLDPDIDVVNDEILSEQDKALTILKSLGEFDLLESIGIKGA